MCIKMGDNLVRKQSVEMDPIVEMAYGDGWTYHSDLNLFEKQVDGINLIRDYKEMKFDYEDFAESLTLGVKQETRVLHQVERALRLDPTMAPLLARSIVFPGVLPAIEKSKHYKF